jgi:hypothetical protein
LRQAGLATKAPLPTVNLGVKSIAVDDRRRHRDRDLLLVVLTSGFIAAAELGLKEHHRLTLARQMRELCLVGRRASSKLAA